MDTDLAIETWKIKRLVKMLENARGNGTSMISLILPPKDSIARASRMLVEEFGTASNIKSRVNRQSVQSAITSTQQKLKLYNKVPPNGLIIYCGEVISAEGKEKKLNMDFEPFKPLRTSLYLCDNKFHTEALSELLMDDSRFGFIIMDGNGCMFATVSGNTREVLSRFSVDLPKKHGRGGQSALRFARLREEKRHNYVRKVAETAVQCFITDNTPNVQGLVLAGSADFKNDLNASDLLDSRLKEKVIKICDVSYGGDSGFNQAIDLSAESLSDVKFVQEKKLLESYFLQLSLSTDKVTYGLEDTLQALEAGAIESLIVFENLDITRWTLQPSDPSQSQIVVHSSKTDTNRAKFMDKTSGQEMDVVNQVALIEWLVEKHRDFGAALNFVSDRSSEGNQFVKAFGGLGAILRYALNLEQLAEISEDEYESD